MQKSNNIIRFVTTFMYARKKNAPVSEQKLQFLRTYKNERKGLRLRNIKRSNTMPTNGDNQNDASAEDLQIWEVARAATAAPMYFKELPVRREMADGETTIYYSDGGFGQTNNPTYEGISEIESLHGGKGSVNVGVVVSVGTSRKKLEAGGKSIFKRVKTSFDRATDPQVVHEKVEREDLQHYWRFNDFDGVDVDLDEWKPNGYFTKHPGTKTLKKITNDFNAWVMNGHLDDLRSCAKELVARRRARIRKPAQWDVYATNASFTCTQADCTSETFNDRHLFRNHLSGAHSVPASELSSMVRQCTKMWRYQRPRNSSY